MVTVVLLHIEVHTAVAHIGISMVQNLLHQLLLLNDMPCGMRFDAGRQTSQGIHSLVEAIGIVLGHLHGFQLLQTCLLGYLILTLISIMLQMPHIGDITHIAHLVAYVSQISEEEVEGDGRTRMPQMSIAIDGGTAYIHTHVSWVQGPEEFLLPRECIINNEWLFHNLCLFHRLLATRTHIRPRSLGQSYGIIPSRQRG